MTRALRQSFPDDAFLHEVRFPPARKGHGMVGSGLFVLHPPYGLQDEACSLSAKLETLK